MYKKTLNFEYLLHGSMSLKDKTTTLFLYLLNDKYHYLYCIKCTDFIFFNFIFFYIDKKINI